MPSMAAATCGRGPMLPSPDSAITCGRPVSTSRVRTSYGVSGVAEAGDRLALDHRHRARDGGAGAGGAVEAGGVGRVGAGPGQVGVARRSPRRRRSPGGRRARRSSTRGSAGGRRRWSRWAAGCPSRRRPRSGRRCRPRRPCRAPRGWRPRDASRRIAARSLPLLAAGSTTTMPAVDRGGGWPCAPPDRPRSAPGPGAAHAPAARPGARRRAPRPAAAVAIASAGPVDAGHERRHRQQRRVGRDAR